MTVLLRCGLLSLLCLTAFAMSASAECAWVLWEQYENIMSPVPPKLKLTVKQGFSDEKSCKAQASKSAAEWNEMAKQVDKKAQFNPTEVQALRDCLRERSSRRGRQARSG